MPEQRRGTMQAGSEGMANMRKPNGGQGRLKRTAGALAGVVMAAAVVLGASGCLNIKVDKDAVRVNDKTYVAPKDKPDKD
jgi:hypothetical protein